MEDKKNTVVKYIKEKLNEFEELGKTYSEEKINILATNLSASEKSLDEIKRIIDNRFSYQIRKINHNNHLASLKEYYLSSIDKLKRGNNCYLLSYHEGIKILEQARIDTIKEINSSLKSVRLNGKTQAYRKENSINNDYELIMSDIAYVLNIPYANTYRIFDKNMNADGILNESFDDPTSRFLTLEETLQFIKEESSHFFLREQLVEYHAKRIKQGLIEIPDKKEYKENIEYVLKLFKALPDITDENYEILKKEYLNMKIFELLTNSLNNNLSNIGIIANKEKKRYSYTLSPSYNKYNVKMPKIAETKTICNFYIVEKKELLHTLIVNYYNDVKELLSLISTNKESLISIITQIIKEHLEYEEYNYYYETVKNNINMINEETVYKKMVSKDTLEDHNLYTKNNEEYENRIIPFVDNYVVDDYNDEKGSAALATVIAFILIVTILLVIVAIYFVSKVEM